MALGKNTKSSLSYLLIQREDGSIDTVLEQDEVFNCLVQQFTAHFSQADGTPFTTPPLTTKFGPNGTNSNSIDLLQGKFTMSTLEAPDSVLAILDKLRYVQEKDSVPMHLTSKDLRSGIPKWKESTSTSPSGIHLGHDKALLQMEHPPSESEEDNQLSTWALASCSFFHPIQTSSSSSC
jgi:hypothetical protein